MLPSMCLWVKYAANKFATFASTMLKRANGLQVYTIGERRFKELFGVDAEVCTVLWDELLAYKPDGGKPIHLLWALIFCKVYGTEEVHCTIADVSPMTYRRWVWSFLNSIFNLKLVRIYNNAMYLLVSLIHWKDRLHCSIRIEEKYRAF